MSAAAPRVLVTGASGLIGRALARQRAVVALPRRQPADGGPWWDPEAGAVHAGPGPVAAVVHLAGENVAGRRWNAAHKARVLDSRVRGTRALVDWMAARSQRPAVFVAASAVGLYGDRGDEVLSEASPRGEGFLADVTAAWEAEIARAAELGVRTVRLRIGVVLSPEGGALAKMLPAFRAGVGGPIGSGRQWFPWVHLDDVVNVIERALTDGAMRGAYNLTAPGILRQRDFARALGRGVRRPAFLPAPGRALRVLFGELANEGLLASTRAVPTRLVESGYGFAWPEIDGALGDLLR